jgi:hypothetical protein
VGLDLPFADLDAVQKALDAEDGVGDLAALPQQRDVALELRRRNERRPGNAHLEVVDRETRALLLLESAGR